MLYTISNIQQKTSAKGTNYQTADLMDANGQVTESVSTFNGEYRTEGMSIDGSIETKDFGGKTYYNFKAQASTRPAGAAKTAQMEKVMDKKADQIEHAQDRKNDAIAHAGAITNATHLLVALIEKDTFSSSQNPLVIPEEFYKNKLRELIIFYKNLYQHPDDVNPSSVDVPF